MRMKIPFLERIIMRQEVLMSHKIEVVIKASVIARSTSMTFQNLAQETHQDQAKTSSVMFHRT